MIKKHQFKNCKIKYQHLNRYTLLIKNLSSFRVITVRVKYSSPSMYLAKTLSQDVKERIPIFLATQMKILILWYRPDQWWWEWLTFYWVAINRDNWSTPCFTTIKLVWVQQQNLTSKSTLSSKVWTMIRQQIMECYIMPKTLARETSLRLLSNFEAKLKFFVK
jgi:hypothetical protein